MARYGSLNRSSKKDRQTFLDGCVWLDKDNGIHIDLVKACRLLKMDPTPANQDKLDLAIRKHFAEHQPHIPVIAIVDS